MGGLGFAGWVDGWVNGLGIGIDGWMRGFRMVGCVNGWMYGFGMVGWVGG